LLLDQAYTLDVKRMDARRYMILGLLLLTAGTCVKAQAPPAPSGNENLQKEETCTVSGMVVRRDDGVPLKGALVRLSDPADHDREQHTIAVKSKADGRYELKNVPAGKYRLSATRNGYFEVQYGQNKPSDPGATFTLVAGQRMSDITLKLGRAGVITGHVVDEDGEAIPEATVIALRTQYEKGHKELQPRAFTQSNDLGEFRLHGLAPGRYYVSAEIPSWRRVEGEREFSGEDKAAGEKGYTKMYYPGYTDPAKGSAITVKEGEEIPAIDLFMKEVTVYRIRGKVINQATKGGVRNGIVQVRARNQHSYWVSYGSENMLKPGGSFEIANVPAGEYTVVVILWDEGKNYMTQQDVDVAAADVEGLALVVGLGMTIPGKIIWDGQASLSKDDFAVQLVPETVDFWGGGDSHIEENNQFTLKEVTDGTFKVQVTGLSKDCYVKQVRYGDNTLPDTQIRVGKGSTGSLEITVSSRGARAEGMVLTEDNLPAVGVWVVAVPDESKRQFARLYKAERTDQNGAFSLHGLVPGKYKLFSWSSVEEGAWEDEDFLKPFEEKGETVEVQEGDRKSLELKLIASKDSTAKPE